MGRVAHLTNSLGRARTSLSQELNYFIRTVTVVAVVVGAACMCAALLMRYTWFEAAFFLIGVIVAQVPEGLLPTVTVALALTARRLAVRNCLVRNLEAVETLGSVSTICTDKTGTLTQNRMSVAHLWFNEVLVEDVDKQFDIPYDQQSLSTWTSLAKIVMLCSRAVFMIEEDDGIVTPHKRKVIGDASEEALLRFVEYKIGDVAQFREVNPKVAEVPFNSINKFQLSIHRTVASDGDNRLLLVMKGAPERILQRCSTILVKGEEIMLTQAHKNRFNDIYRELGGQGERVLGFCDYRLPAEEFSARFKFDTEEMNFPTTELRFVGLIGMIDPPRASVPDAVAKCRCAGIQVVMITGDHPITAKSIARTIGIISPGNRTMEELAEERGCSVEEVDPRDAAACVVNGAALRASTPLQLDRLLTHYNEVVFARTSPEQKLYIVEGFQRKGLFVAVTGDEVNDSPALKAANIGIAMGIAGSDVSRQAADMILLDDNFSTIVSGIEEGRIIFENLKKSIVYTMTSKIPELMPFLMFMLAGIPLMLGTVTILCIDLGTDILPAIAMAYEQPESDIMRRRPRNAKTDRLVNSRLLSMCILQIGMIQTAAAFFCGFHVMADNGFLPNRLIGIRANWTERSVDNLEDSFGQEWTYDQRMELQYTVYAMFFLTVVIVQWAGLVISKTRRLSLFQHGFHNHVLTFALYFETTLAVVLQSVPYVNKALQLHRLHTIWCLVALPFAVLIIIYDEIRKWLIRLRPHGFFHRETYY